MKKIYSIISMLFIGFAAQAQIDLKSTLIKPTAGTTVEATKSFAFDLTVQVASGSIAPADTV